MNTQPDEAEGTLRIKKKKKNTVKIGNLSRGGQSRVDRKADDHDFGITGQLTPVGIYRFSEKEFGIVTTLT